MEEKIVNNLYKVVRVEKDGFYSVNVRYPVCSICHEVKIKV